MTVKIIRILAVCYIVGFGAVIPKASAEDPFDALRLELSLIGSQMEDLRLSLLSPEVRSLAPGDAGIALLRLDALEAKLRSTVGRVEALEFHLEILSKDATHRISEFNTKLKDLEYKNEVANLQPNVEESDVQPSKKQFGEVSNEILAFDKALLSFSSKDAASARGHFEAFINLYPDSMNVPEAYFWLGETNSQLEDYKKAAAAFLESFSLAPGGLFAWRSMLGLAISLGDLGQLEQGCLTLGELKSRFPESVRTHLDEVLLAEEQLKCVL